MQDNMRLEVAHVRIKCGLPTSPLRYETQAQAMREITEPIEIFYNRQRRHSKLGYLAPAVFALKCQYQVSA